MSSGSTSGPSEHRYEEVPEMAAHFQVTDSTYVRGRESARAQEYGLDRPCSICLVDFWDVPLKVVSRLPCSIRSVYWGG